MIESDLRTYLIAHEDIQPLVGTRVYPMFLPQNPTLPAITYQRVSGNRVQSLKGVNSLSHPRIQYDCWAESYTDVKDLAEKLINALNDYSGVIFYNDRDLYEQDVELYRVSIDISIWHHAT
jgi:hypothetical protein